jgi:hypothetical protein
VPYVRLQVDATPPGPGLSVGHICTGLQQAIRLPIDEVVICHTRECRRDGRCVMAAIIARGDVDVPSRAVMWMCRRAR